MKLSEAQQLLRDGVKATIESGRFQQYLDFMASFHDYSPNNCMMIMSHKPDATLVAGFRAWLQKGRYVRKGEKGIPIIVPMMGKKKKDEEDDGTLPSMRFGVGYVFDVSQTEGEEVPHMDVPMLLDYDDNHAAAYGVLLDLAKQYGVGVRVDAMEEFEPECMGYYTTSTNMVTLRDSLGMGLQAVKTLAHELAHSQTPDRKKLHRDEAEAIAEGVAYVICKKVFGFDTSERSFPYIVHWCEDYDRFMGVMALIHAMSKVMVADLEKIGGVHGESVEVA